MLVVRLAKGKLLALRRANAGEWLGGGESAQLLLMRATFLRVVSPFRRQTGGGMTLLRGTEMSLKPACGDCHASRFRILGGGSELLISG